MSFAADFLQETAKILAALDTGAIEAVAQGLAGVRERGGRLFILGVGGSAGHAGHAVNDFRKICAFEAYAPTDNVSELTARTNDEGWETVFEAWLKGSRIGARDGLLIFSVGGGDKEKNVSVNLIRAIDAAKTSRRRGLRNCRPQRRLYQSQCDGLRRRAATLSRPHHAAYGRPGRRYLASAGQPSGAEGGRDEMGVRSLKRSVSPPICCGPDGRSRAKVPKASSSIECGMKQ